MTAGVILLDIGDNHDRPYCTFPAHPIPLRELEIGTARSARTGIPVLGHRREAPVAMFSLDGGSRFRLFDVGRTDVSAYQDLLTEGASRARPKRSTVWVKQHFKRLKLPTL